MPPLTDHESEQVREIALWKSERPSLLLASYRGLIRPLSKLVAWSIPNELAKQGLARAEALAEFHEPAADIIEASGVSAIPDLLNRTLEECDQLSRMVSGRAEHLALLEGAVPAGVGLALPLGGGAAAAIADVPVLLEATIHAVRRIGHCYGFPLVGESDRRFVLAILGIANHETPAGLEEERLGLWASQGLEPDDGAEAAQGARGVIG